MKKNIMRPVMIMAGGTGGHVYPALAVADELKQRGVPVVWMGTKKGIEARLVPEAGIEVDWLSMSGLRGKGKLTLLLAPLKIMFACTQALNILIKRKPLVVLGMGGFVSAPGGLMAWLIRIPLLIHEQNAMPGMSNRILSKLANSVLEAFPNSFDKKSIHVGNPVRKEIIEIADPQTRYENKSEALNILVFGGSLGAAHLNEVVPSACAEIAKEKLIKIRHQTGPGHLEETKLNYENLGLDVELFEYVNDMANMYAWADIVICRSGAMTVSELSVAGVASILVPYPYAVDDHQTYNAKYLSDKKAAILIKEEKLNKAYLVDVFKNLNKDKTLEMSIAAKSLGIPQSTDLVTNACLKAGGYDVN